MAEALELTPHDRPHVGLVLDDEDRARRGRRRRPARRSSPASAARSPASGRNRLTVVPRPTSDAIFTVPPDCFAKPYTMLRPRPVPRPPVFVREERLEHARHDVGRHAASRCPRARCARRAPARRSSSVSGGSVILTVDVWIASEPPSGIASRAFSATFSTAASSAAGSANAIPASVLVDVVTPIVAPSVRPSSRTMPATTTLTSTGLRVEQAPPREREQVAGEILAVQRGAEHGVDDLVGVRILRQVRSAAARRCRG